jgi:hypothetical protein
MTSKFDGLGKFIIESFETHSSDINQYYNAMLLKLIEFRNGINTKYNNLAVSISSNLLGNIENIQKGFIAKFDETVRRNDLQEEKCDSVKTEIIGKMNDELDQLKKQMYTEQGGNLLNVYITGCLHQDLFAKLELQAH